MTMQKQELTLFGGWAKAQIRPPIEHGVAERSVMPSASILINDWLFLEGKTYVPNIEVTTLARTQNICIQRCYTVQKLFYGVTFAQEEFEYVDPTRLLIPSEFDEEKMIFSHWHYIANMWIHPAFVRFFELWGRGTSEKMVHAFLGTPRLRRHFAGRFGACNGKSLIKNQETGEWTVKSLELLYPRERHLPPEGIRNARIHAHKLRDQRLAARQARFEHGEKP